MDFSIDVLREEHGVKCLVSGEIDAFTAPKLRERLNTIELEEKDSAELNLSQVGYMDSTGLGVIVAFYKRVIAKKGSIKLTGLSPRLYRLFEITGLSKIMEIEKEGEVATNHESL